MALASNPKPTEYPLHQAENKKIAQKVVSSVKRKNRRKFLLAVDNNGQTALHVAAKENRTDVFNYIMSFFQDHYYTPQLVEKCDNLGRTALHYAQSTETACKLVTYLRPEGLATNLILSTMTIETIPKKTENKIPINLCYYLRAFDNKRRTALHTAAHHGATEVAKYLCDMSPYLYLERDEQGKAALHYANNQITVEILSDAYINWEGFIPRDNFNCTPLHLAAYEGRADVVKRLCEMFTQSHNVSQCRDIKERIPLHFAKDEKTAQFLLDSIPIAAQRYHLAATDYHGCTPLHAAAYLGRLSVVQLLCREYISNNYKLLSVREQNGRTPLHYAKSKKIAECLVQAVKEPAMQKKYVISEVDREGCTALHVAVNEGKTGVVRYLCNLAAPDDELVLKTDGNGHTALHYAKTRDIAQLLIESVQPGNRRRFILAAGGDMMCTALHAAVNANATSVARFLCSRQLYASELLHKVDVDGQTPLHYAKGKNMTQLLFKYVEVSKRQEYIGHTDIDKCTALHCAAAAGRKKVVERLCKFGQERGLSLKKNVVGRTALHFAPNNDIAKLLIESVELEKQRSHLETVDDDGKTVLHLAAEEARNKVVRYVCSIPPARSGLALMKDNIGRTALHYAFNKETAELLLECVEPQRREDYVLMVDHEGKSVLAIAIEESKNDVLEYIFYKFPALGALESLQRAMITNTPPLSSVYHVTVAQLLIETIEPEMRDDYILACGHSGKTALHVAAEEGKTEMVRYICQRMPASIRSELIVIKDNDGRTALHYALNRETAEVLIDSVEPGKQYDFIQTVDAAGRTAADVASYPVPHLIRKKLQSLSSTNLQIE